MSTSDQLRQDPAQSQSESSDPKRHRPGAPLSVRSPKRPRHGQIPLSRAFLQDKQYRFSPSKVSPFKSNKSKPRRLPPPTFTPIPFNLDEDRISPSPGKRGNSSCSRQKQPTSDPLKHAAIIQLPAHKEEKPTPTNNNRVSDPSIPPDIDVPSPPALSSSDDNETEKDEARVNIPHQSRCLPYSLPCEVQSPTCRSPVTDTCNPPDFSQDSAFFSFSNTQHGNLSNHENEMRSQQDDRRRVLTEHHTEVPNRAPKHYYTRTFDYVTGEVLRRYCRILPYQDVDIARILRNNLSGNAQALFVRLYGRKQPQWYRLSRLEDSYSGEINVCEGIDELCRERFLISSVYALKGSPKSSSLLARELLSVLDLSEIRAVCASVVDGSSLRRLSRNRLLPALRKLLSNSYSSHQRSKKKLTQTTLSGLKPAECLARAVLKLAGHSVRIPENVLSSLKRIHFLFFLEDGHDSPNVILADTGKVRFPTYRCHPERGVFPSSRALEEYEAAIQLEQCINESLERKDWSQAAYFGSIAELEVRELFICFEGREERKLSSPACSRSEFEKPSSTLENLCSSRRPVLKKRIDRKEQLEQLSHPFLRRYTAQWVFVRSCWHSVHALERMTEYQNAVSRLKLLLSTDLMPRRRGKCLARLTINLFKHLGQLEEPLQIIVAALSSSVERLHLGDQIGLAQRGAAIHAKLAAKGPREGHRNARTKADRIRRGGTAIDSSRPRVIVEALKRAATRISVRKIFGKSLNVQSKEEKDRIQNIEDPWIRYKEENHRHPPLESSGMDLPIQGKSVYWSHRKAGGRVSVEDYCLEWYDAKEHLNGAHDEGKSVRFLFALFLWECALFAEVPDVFQTPYQDRPLDLYTDAFYPSRKEEIDNRLEEIAVLSSDEIYAETLCRYRQFDGIRAVGCIWASYAPEDMAIVAAGLGGEALAHCCRLLAEDYSYWSGGLPDLTLWRADDDDDSDRRRYRTKLVEVKSARDSLSEKQRAWLMELQSSGVDCEVCKVVERVTARNQVL